MGSLKSRGSYVLVTLSTLFAVGAAIRFVPSNVAAADTAPVIEHPVGELLSADVPDVASHPNSRLVPIEQVCFTDETAAGLAADVELVATQKAALNERELSLKAREAQLEGRATELQALQLTLDERWGEMQTESNDDILHLARMYGTMKPDQAAAIFNQMEPEFAGGFLRQMRSEQAGLILASMETRKAYAVSLQLASVNDDIRQSAVSN